MKHITISYPIEDRYLGWSCLLRNVIFPVGAGVSVLFVAWGSAQWMTKYGGNQESVVNVLAVLSVVFGMAVLMYRPLLALRLTGRKYIVGSYLEEDTPLRTWLQGRTIPAVLAAISSLLLSIVLYVTLQTLGVAELIGVAIAMAIALYAQQIVACLIATSLKPHVTDMVLRKVGRALGLGLTVVVLAIVGVTQDGPSGYKTLTELDAAQRIRQEVVHPLGVIEKAARISKYFEVQLLRLRDQAAFPVGWLIYLCFVVPSAIPAYAMVNVVAGCTLSGCGFESPCEKQDKSELSAS
jgi:hypothetical protein